MKNRLKNLILVAVTGVAILGSSTVMAYNSDMRFINCMTQDEYIALVESCTSEEDYVRKLHSLGYGTDEDLNAALNKINGTSTPSTSTPSTPKVETTKCEHTYTSERVLEPTCTNKGIEKFTCDKCGNTYEETIDVSPSAHKYEVTEEVKATCTDSGSVTYTCSECGDTYTELTDKLSHDYISAETVEPTCTVAGIRTYTCTKCNDTYDEQVTALGHDEGTWVVTKENTLFTEGNKELHCNRCNELITTETIPSTYPIYYLYIAVAVVIVLVLVLLLIIRKLNNK